MTGSQGTKAQTAVTTISNRQIRAHMTFWINVELIWSFMLCNRSDTFRLDIETAG
ncbi:hypothetical protein A3768_3632 [Ralstonia solanacearum]|nr:hypothetical protein A3768_3632 [Ralstonia solanacearum]ARU21753.1 Transcriptional regulator, MarR family [Ralstonia solanacearum]